jgi:hypothetical protein
MEKQQTSSLMGEKLRRIRSKSYLAVPLKNGISSENSSKLSRDEVSRCIIIWAQFYCREDDKLGGRTLCLPSGPWIEKS